MYFPNANQMTMKGMRTPIKYYGITDGMITDEGYARPGQKFNVNGVSTLEVRMPQMRYGGRAKYQLGSYITSPNFLTDLEEMQNAEAVRRLSSKPRNLTIQDEVSDPNVVAMIERVLANPNDPNNKALLSDPKFLALIDAYRNKPKPITEVLNNLIAIIQTDPTNAAAAVANFESLLGNYSPSELATALPLIKQFESQFTPNEFQRINATVIENITKRNAITEDPYFSYDKKPFGPRIASDNDEIYIQKYAPEGFGVGKNYATREDFLKDLDQFLINNPPGPKPNTDGTTNLQYLFPDKGKWDEWKNNKKSNNPVVTTNTGTIPVVNQPVVTTTTPPVVAAKPPKPRGTAYPGYTIPEWIGPGKEYESVEDYQRAIKEFAKETNTSYTLSGANQGMDNVYGYSSDLFLKDPARKAAFEKWKASKKPATVTTTPVTTTTVTGNTATTTNPNEVKTEPKKDVTVDGDKKVRYTDPNSVESIYLDENRYPNRWVQTPMGYVKLNDQPDNLPAGSFVGWSGKRRRKETGWDFEPGSLNSWTKRDDGMDFGPGVPYTISAPTLFNSKKISEKLKGAYDKIDQGFDNFTNMIYSDRSDRAARRAERFLARAEAAEAIGNDRRAGRLYRKAERQIARVEPLQRIQDANEERKDYEAQMALDKMLKYKLALKENLANERRISAKAEAERTPEFWQSKSANKMSKQSSIENDKRERTEGKYNRARLDAQMETERNKDKDESRDFRTGLNENYKAIKNQYEEQNQNEIIHNRLLNRDLRAQRRYHNEVQGLKEDYAPTPTTEQFWGDYNDKSYNIFRRKKELGGELPKFAGSGLFNGDPDPIPNNYPKYTLPKYEHTPWTPQEKPEPIKMPMIDASKDFSNWVKNEDEKFHNYYFDIGNPAVVEENGYWINVKNKDPKNSKGPGMGFYGHTPGEFTQFAGTMMPAFYNLAQSMRKPHKFKEFQNPYAGRYLSNLASQYLPYDDSKIVAQQNRVMRNAQQQAPNFQVAQAYQMAGMDSLNRQLKDYQMKNFMGNQELAKQYNQAAYNVAGEQQAIKAQAYENDRKTQATLNQMQHKAVTQFGVGIHDLGKLMVNREMNAMDWSLMSQVYQQYGLAPFEAVMSGQISYDDMVKYKNNPVAMQEIMRRTEKAKAENAAAKQTQQTTTENYDNSGINASSTTTTTPRAGAAGGGAGIKKTGGKLFNLNVIKKY